MKWLIIIFIMMSLIGSVMWVMPTPRQKFQAQLRLRARKFGFQVQLAQLQLPRQKGEMEAETITVPVYRLVRSNLSRDERDSWTSWQLCRANTLATTGLPDGWSWIKGERELPQAALTRLCEILVKLPSDVVGLESTPIHLSAFWQEGSDEALEQIAQLLNILIEARV